MKMNHSIALTFNVVFDPDIPYFLHEFSVVAECKIKSVSSENLPSGDTACMVNRYDKVLNLSL